MAGIGCERSQVEEIEIARASAADAEEILCLQKLAYRSEAEIYDDWTLPPLHQTLEEITAEFTTHVFLKAICNQGIVGSVRARQRDGACYIGRLIVDPEYQNRGLGTRLMLAIEEAHRDAERFQLYTGAQSLRNLHLYQKLGYQETKRERLSSRVELVYMEKESTGDRPCR
jgi:ribosomal protein S18 acetylase RimI-like enzyme